VLRRRLECAGDERGGRRAQARLRERGGAPLQIRDNELPAAAAAAAAASARAPPPGSVLEA